MSTNPIPPIDQTESPLLNQPEFAFPIPEEGDVEVPMLNRADRREILRASLRPGTSKNGTRKPRPRKRRRK